MDYSVFIVNKYTKWYINIVEQAKTVKITKITKMSN